MFLTARDRNGRIITDLTQNELKLFEDRQEQKIDSLVWGVPGPLVVGLLIDVSGSRLGELVGAERKAAPIFFRRVLGKDDLAFVIAFGKEDYPLSDFTNKLAQLDSAVELASAKSPQGKTALHDVIAKVCREKLSGRPGRKALVLVSDGGDNASRTRNQDAIQIAQLTDTVIYAIDLSESNWRQASSPEELVGGKVLREFAEQTGGRSFTVRHKRDFQAAFELIAEELRGQYTLQYRPSNAVRDRKFRKLKINTTRKRIELLTRKGYYAPKN